MKALELVRLDRGLVVVQVFERVLGTVVVGIIVSIDGLRLESGNGIELLDRRSSKSGQSSEDRTLDFRDFRILDSIHERVLRL